MFLLLEVARQEDEKKQQLSPLHCDPSREEKKTPTNATTFTAEKHH